MPWISYHTKSKVPCFVSSYEKVERQCRPVRLSLPWMFLVLDAVDLLPHEEQWCRVLYCLTKRCDDNVGQYDYHSTGCSRCWMPWICHHTKSNCAVFVLSHEKVGDNVGQYDVTPLDDLGAGCRGSLTTRRARCRVLYRLTKRWSDNVGQYDCHSPGCSWCWMPWISYHANSNGAVFCILLRKGGRQCRPNTIVTSLDVIDAE
ncbi:hypothetical protein KIN20_007851 [Parelaphostrongylus tenuis]|uniref:Uncharacterized protein n=1 Tax=Parelaphostrongylus tenuis TaxID=148309 RepID=A0AAD5MLZ3_PARTN|nr:hypothetical protein KIN20_007851 [Parelaphostrongylus tenuis]